jgi:hypothetical protein
MKFGINTMVAYDAIKSSVGFNTSITHRELLALLIDNAVDSPVKTLNEIETKGCIAKSYLLSDHSEVYTLIKPTIRGETPILDLTRISQYGPGPGYRPRPGKEIIPKNALWSIPKGIDIVD